MCKKRNGIPSVEERKAAWINSYPASRDELSLLVNAQLIADWEAEGHTTDIVESFRAKMNQGIRSVVDVPDEELLIDGISEEFPGDECVIKGIRRPGDNTVRYLNTRKANARAVDGAKSIGTHVTINRGENGNTRPKSNDEWLKTTVAAKKKPKPGCGNYFKKLDRRKTRHEGKVECFKYTPVFITETEPEETHFPEREDGTIDVDAYIKANADNEPMPLGWSRLEDPKQEIADIKVDFSEVVKQAAALSAEIDKMVESLRPIQADEISRLKREINLYRDFIGEFNLNKLYQTWLANNGN